MFRIPKPYFAKARIQSAGSPAALLHALAVIRSVLAVAVASERRYLPVAVWSDYWKVDTLLRTLRAQLRLELPPHVDTVKLRGHLIDLQAKITGMQLVKDRSRLLEGELRKGVARLGALLASQDRDGQGDKTDLPSDSSPGGEESA